MSTTKEVEVDNTPIKNRVEINDSNPHVLICVYGTLRQGEGNWKRCLQHTNSEFLGTFKTDPKYTMYGRRAGFPILVPEGNTSVTIEVFKVKNQNVLDGLHALEGCTGIPGDRRNWYDIMEIDVPTGPKLDPLDEESPNTMEKAWIYVHRTHKADPDSVIKTGDWKHKSV